MAKNRSASELSNMNKQQLLELLLEQSKEADALKRENIEMQKELHRARKQAAEYRSDLDHTYSLLRLTMRLENIIQKLDPSYVPDHYEPGLMARLQEEDKAQAAKFHEMEAEVEEILPEEEPDTAEAAAEAFDSAEEAADNAEAVMTEEVRTEEDDVLSDVTEAAEEETRRGRFFGRRE